VAGLLLGVCCFCAALAAVGPRQSAAHAWHGSSDDAEAQRFNKPEGARRLQQQSGAATVTQARVLVVPRLPCQLVDAEETQCVASLEAAFSTHCTSKAMTGATA
jgi:hypothetical protein